MRCVGIHVCLIIFAWSFISLRSADRNDDIQPVSSDSFLVAKNAEPNQKRLIVFFGPPYAGQKEVYKSLRSILNDLYGKMTFLISQELSDKRAHHLQEAKNKGSARLQYEETQKDSARKTEVEKMFCEDLDKMPSADEYDEVDYRENLKFVLEARDRLKDPANKACFYAMFFWTKDPLVGKRFQDFLSEHADQYFLIKIMSKLRASNARLAAEMLETSESSQEEFVSEKEKLKHEYRGQKKKFTAFDESLFHLSIDTTHCKAIEKKENVENLITSPRANPIDVITDPYSPKKLERVHKIEKTIGGYGGYEDEAAKIIYLLKLETGEQEFRKRIR